MPTRLPDFPLRPAGPAATGFLSRGLGGYRDAARWVLALPYGRGQGRDELAIFSELRGTCSTKHALLARLAAEHGVAVELVLAIYLMSEQNTPGVGEVLRAHHIDAIPEAHCVLRWHGRLIDLTRALPPSASPPPALEFLHTRTIVPADIAAHKPELHRRYLADWIATKLPDRTLDEVWSIREACIAALAMH